MKLLKSSAFKFTLKLLISAVLLIFIFKFVGIGKIYNELLHVEIYYILLAIIFVLFGILLKSIRWGTIITAFGKRISIVYSLKYTLTSMAFGMVTPGRLGEFIKVKFLVDTTGISYLKSFATVVMDKIFDVMASTFLLFAGLYIFWMGKPIAGIIALGFALYLTILILIFIYFDKTSRLINYFLPHKYKLSLKRLDMGREFYFKSLAYSICLWVAFGVQAFLIMVALKTPTPFFMILIIVPLMALSSAIPISIGGTGLRELVAIYLLLPSGIHAEKSVVFSLIYAFIGLGIPAIIGAILYIKGKNV